MDPIKILNTTIDREKIIKLGNTQKPSSVMSLWERLKDLFGLSNEGKVLPLIKTVYFDQAASVSEKNSAFFTLKRIAGDGYKNNFKYSVNDSKITYSIEFIGDPIESDHDIKPFFEEIKNELSIDLEEYSSDSVIAFINNYSKLSVIKNDDKNYEEKFIAFRAILMEPRNKGNIFSINDFNKIGSFEEKKEYIEKHSHNYTANLSPTRLIDNIYQSVKQGNYEELRSQVEKDISRYKLQYNNKDISDISSLEEKLKNLNKKDVMIIFELLNQGIFPVIKDSFDKYDPIASQYSPLTGKTTINIEENEGRYTIIINNKKEMTESDIEKVSHLSDNILTDFDHDSMHLYSKYFIDDKISMNSFTSVLAKYKHEISKRMEDSLSNKFNYKQDRFLLLEEDINVKLEFSPYSLKKLTASDTESKIEYRLLKS
ncbi:MULTISPECIES: hypothetical protein [Proteus]|jgi:hypothetical protein|uniref:Uncharacterized protein n=3 Tax=Proteus vulgaris TaxID=585 RepID=A0A379FEB4_PROVU|nr:MULTISPECIES: hypothetical protein [Proteus]RNT29095.1 hypothetical protein B9475_007595 [Proteus mirabilis]KGA60281.1 hypothetical protein DR95_802 [Proteus vulgaris]MBG5969670.1 hypothetical protein [Proteus vulgaris]MBG5983417.1 hypothetical protein [Proteus vulgaris]MBI6510111.1 hypothetical protein [Proteus sp. PR00174]